MTRSSATRSLVTRIRSTRISTLACAKAGAVLLAVVILDQLTKRIVEHSIAPGEERGVLPGIEIVNTRNRGVAFGFLPGRHFAVTLLVGVALLALLVYFARNSTKPLVWLPTGMVLGGAIGNIIDRLRAGSVTDFVKLPLGWPPFNLADASITVGVILLVIVVETPRARGTPRGTSSS